MASQQNLIKVAVLMTVLTIANASTPFRHCADSSNPLPLMVQIDNCEQLPCDVWKSMESKIIVQFVATRNAMAKLNARVQLTSLGMNIPYELEAQRSNVCANLMYGAYCPLDAGEDATYQLMLPVANNQPEVPTRLELTLYDAERADQVVACFLADMRVRKPSH
ncbi:Npc2c [Drosophila busckii]|uniref:Npc2c n=1 Tax=Drosophila busckii TaxID=30019 RepID=A0A0M5J4W6_DROBS|nr:uncharacterized protein LOC108602574 [Drosophila busckii]ALC46468.1 Npc2c [Drosophila busckii]